MSSKKRNAINWKKLAKINGQQTEKRDRAVYCEWRPTDEELSENGGEKSPASCRKPMSIAGSTVLLLVSCSSG